VTLYRMAKTNNPLFYFGSVGFSTIGLGMLLGVYVLYDWFVNGISHEIIATIGGIAVVLGIQLLMFGVLSDMIVTVNREQTQQLENIANRLNEERPGPPRSGSDGEARTADQSEADSEGRTPHQSAGDGETETPPSPENRGN